MRFGSGLVWIKGGGDLGSGVAYRLHMAGFPVLITELARPLAIRRPVCFAEAVVRPEGRQTVEGVTAVRVKSSNEVARALAAGQIPVAVDPQGILAKSLAPEVLVDATMAKSDPGTSLSDAPVVIGLGPGFSVGENCHAAIETARGHWLGRALYQGSALPDTGTPGEVVGVGAERLVRAPVTGIFRGRVEIGTLVDAGAILGAVIAEEAEPELVLAAIPGVVRGLIAPGTRVTAGMKIGDIDPTGERERCTTISDKALAVAGGVLEAVFCLHSAEGA